MTDSSNTRLHKIATFLINNRYGIVALFALITVGMMFAMSQLRIETGFKKQLPLKHEYMQTFLQYEKEFGGANRILVALVARDGNMFTPEFFEAFEAITNKVFFIPGVDRASVRSFRRDRRGRFRRRQRDSVGLRAFAGNVRAGPFEYRQVGRSRPPGLGGFFRRHGLGQPARGKSADWRKARLQGSGCATGGDTDPVRE
jgi:hypothetical protein